MKNDLGNDHLDQAITLTLPLRAVLQLGAPFPDPLPSKRLDSGQLPAIGATVNGERFAGLSIAQDGQPVSLWLLESEAEPLTWKQAGEWAEGVGGDLPSRIDMLVLFKNLRAEFKESAYWTCEESADDADWAWYQYFDNGDQDYNDKNDKLRARAVRRSPL
jgi:hypothetical protein